MKRWIPLLLFLALPLGAGEVRVPESVTVKYPRTARIVCESKAKTVQLLNVWEDTDSFREWDPDGKFVFRFYADQPGRYKLAFYAPDNEASPPAYCTVIVEGVVPPAPPVPPVPPVPPTPPIPGEGLRVLMVYESADATKMPAAQQNVLHGAQVRAYLEAHCAPDPDVANWKAYRIWDADTATAAAGKTWQEAMKRPRASLPWIVIATPTTTYEGPLPKTPAEALELLQKYGGR